MSYTTQADLDQVALWSSIAFRFPDVFYISTPFWPPYSKDEAYSLVQQVLEHHAISFEDINPEDRNRLEEMTDFLKQGIRGEADPPPALADEYYKLTMRTYDEHAEDYRQAVVQYAPLDKKLHQFSQLISPQGKIIDIGCGPGNDIFKFQRQGKHVVGLDGSYAMARLAREITGVQIYHMDMRAMNLPEQFVEGIWCVATLLHLPRKDVPVALREFHRILQPAGYLYLSLKQGTGSSLVRREKTGGSPRFFTYFAQQEIAHLLKQAGFTTCEMMRVVTYRKGIGWDAWINILARKH